MEYLVAEEKELEDEISIHRLKKKTSIDNIDVRFEYNN